VKSFLARPSPPRINGREGEKEKNGRRRDIDVGPPGPGKKKKKRPEQLRIAREGLKVIRGKERGREKRITALEVIFHHLQRGIKGTQKEEERMGSL